MAPKPDHGHAAPAPAASPGWRQALAQIVAGSDAAADAARRRWRRRNPSARPRLIVPYLGFGTAQRLHLSGRVLLDPGFAPARAADSGWSNLRQFVKRLASAEIAGARVRARFGAGDSLVEAVSDDEGYFQLDIAPAQALDRAGGVFVVRLELGDAEADDAAKAGTDAMVMVPPANARFGVISDLDDTVVRTHVHDRLKMLLTLARSNAHTREPFGGVAEWYRALQRGTGGADGNPLFYVSSSPWNLYTPLVEFLAVRDIPLGPLLLKDFGDHTLFASREHHGHKRAAIERIVQTYPQLDFVLIGDSGEQDPEIYSGVVHDHPSRVRAVYIRAVRADAARLAAIDRLAAVVQPTGAQLVVVSDSAFAAAHAAGEGLISADALGDVRAQVAHDAAPAHRRGAS